MLRPLFWGSHTSHWPQVGRERLVSGKNDTVEQEHKAVRPRDKENKNSYPFEAWLDILQLDFQDAFPWAHTDKFLFYWS